MRSSSDNTASADDHRLFGFTYHSYELVYILFIDGWFMKIGHIAVIQSVEHT